MVDFNKTEKKWQKAWESKQIFKVKEDPKKKKFYVLEMFPYPSGAGLHMGHAFNYTIGDIYARFMRMNNFNVIYPMGYDSFGLPAENAAIQAGEHPKKYTAKSTANFERQQKELGLSYDWSRRIMTHTPEYYRWNQYFFLKFYEKGLVYRKKAPVNWCPKCNTVLANEQVHNGKCWRHTDTDVIDKYLEQWFIKTTKYADELLEDLKKLDWPDRIKIMQDNWIGKSEGVDIRFKIYDSEEIIETFTTRQDTMYGMTFIVIAPEHPKVMEWVKGTKYEKPVKEFIKKVRKLSMIERTTVEKKEKRGIFLGKYAVHPLTKKKIPIYAADFVLLEFGTGIVQAVPAHDQRDFDFAKEYNLPIVVTIQPAEYTLNAEKMIRAYEGHGTLVNSEEFNGMRSEDALEAIAGKLEKIGAGKRKVYYKLRDWLISRQRYWGTPIPFVYCDKCGIVPVPEKDLPVMLPENVKFGKGNPLATSKSFLEAKCPKCKGKAKRETDTMDTFFDSSWYFLRYCDNKNTKEPFDKKKVDYWMPVNLYIGGAEHACMHLIYARFFTKALRDMKFLKFDEPFLKLFNQGMLHKGGVVMSKSKGNVVLPEEISKTHGIDAARLFLVSIASPDKDLEWSDEGINGSLRFINRVFNFVKNFKNGKISALNESKLNRLMQDYTDDLKNLSYNMAVIKLKEIFYSIEDGCSKEHLKTFIKLISPICPHLAEEFWQIAGNKTFVSVETWPQPDKTKINLKAEAADGTAYSTISDIKDILNLVKIKKPGKITIIIAENWKYDFMKKLKKEVEKTHSIGEIIKAVMDKQHGKEISQLVPRLVKDRARIPAAVTSQKQEFEALEQSKDMFKKEFKADIEIIPAEKSKEPKAKQAMPGKPAILIK
jgi:leucyl-tRNA synthetase